MTTSISSLIAQLDNGTSRPATPDEIITAARDHMSRRFRRGFIVNVALHLVSLPQAGNGS